MTPEHWMTMGWRLYLQTQGLMLLGYALLKGLEILLSRQGIVPNPRLMIRAALGILALSLALPIAVRLLPEPVMLEPAAQVFTSSARALPERLGVLESGSSRTPTEAPAPWPSGHLLLLLMTIGLAGGVAWRLGNHGLRMRRLQRTLQALPLMRRIGRVELRVAPATIPYSTRLDRAYVVLPAELIERPSDLSLTLRHELQHHRQGDTVWLHLLAAVEALSFWNPAVGRWSRWITRYQELACDEALVRHRGVSPLLYARCLYESAQQALESRSLPAGTSGLVTHSTTPLLTRRIEMVLRERPIPSRLPALLIALAFGVMSTGAWAAQSLVTSPAITLEAAQKLVQTPSSAFPIQVTPQVVEKLNTFVGTPKGRKFMQNGLSRMPEHRALLTERLKAAGLPQELLAVPLIESGYLNMDSSSKAPSLAPGMRGAGVWMFIPQTARNFGLRVDETVDERLDVEKETGAAIRYFTSLYKEFGDWSLALAAYNMGEKHVRTVLQERGTRDVPTLVAEGRLNDYVPTVMAGVILLQNPDLVADGAN